MNQKFKAVFVSSSRGGSSPPQPTHLFSRHSAVVAAKAVDHARWHEQNRNIMRDQVIQISQYLYLIAFC